jgi:hypothetical protein
MKKFFLALFLLTLPIHLRGASLETNDILQVVVETCDGVEDLIDVPKEEKKKRRRRFFKKLLLRVVTVAITVFLRDNKCSGGRPFLHDQVVDLCEELSELLKDNGSQFIHYERGSSCLHCAFLLKTKDERREFFKKKFSDKIMSDDLLSSLFSELFNQSYVAMEYFQNHCRKVALNDFKKLYIKTLTVENISNEEDFSFYANFFQKMSLKIDHRSNRASWPAIYCLIKIIADIAAFLFSDRFDQRQNERDDFVDKLATLLKDIRDFIEEDNLLKQFGKISSFFAKFTHIQSKDEWKTVIEDALKSATEGLNFLDEVFFSVRLYVREKLQKTLSKIFCRMVPAIHGGH